MVFCGASSAGIFRRRCLETRSPRYGTKESQRLRPELLTLFDRYIHGGISRRQFFDGAAKFAVGGVTAAALVESLLPSYAAAQQVATNDSRLSADQHTRRANPGPGCRGAILRGTALGRGRGEDQRALLLHYAELDQRINAGWPAYEETLKANGKTYTAHTYPATNHGFHNDTTPRFDEEAAKLAWERTIAFFTEHLR